MEIKSYNTAHFSDLSAEQLDKAANMLNNQHLKMAEYFEMKRLAGTSKYQVVPSQYVDQNKANLIHQNYVNVCYDWMKTQLYFYGELKKKQTSLIELLKERIADKWQNCDHIIP